jgi:ATP-dependent phosphoenolpyruvate carboxykinase
MPCAQNSSHPQFNCEGGCYAKVIRLSAQAEPEITDTTRRYGTILENVGIDMGTRRLDLDDGSLTENTRAAYPISHIPTASRDGRAGHPNHIIFLTADAFGVLPPPGQADPGAGGALLPLRQYFGGVFDLEHTALTITRPPHPPTSTR